MLDEVIVTNEQLTDSLTVPYQNFVHGIKAANFIKGKKDHLITKLKFRVSNVFGVKGLRFLPFKANLYELDSITKLPGRPLLPHDIVVENKSGAKWAVADVSAFRLKLPEKGVFAVFIVPDWEGGFYKTRTVMSSIGEIDAAPFLRYRLSRRMSGSFLYIERTSDLIKYGGAKKKWTAVKNFRYMIEMELEQDPEEKDK